MRPKIITHKIRRQDPHGLKVVTANLKNQFTDRRNLLKDKFGIAESKCGELLGDYEETAIWGGVCVRAQELVLPDEEGAG